MSLKTEVRIQGIEDALKTWSKENIQKSCSSWHRAMMFRALRLLMRLTPVLTGRARASWAPFLIRYGVDYYKSLADHSLVQKGPVGSLSGEAQGLREGTIEVDDPLHTVCGSNVAYMEYLNDGTRHMIGHHMVERVTQKVIKEWDKLGAKASELTFVRQSSGEKPGMEVKNLTPADLDKKLEDWTTP